MSAQHPRNRELGRYRVTQEADGKYYILDTETGARWEQSQRVDILARLAKEWNENGRTWEYEGPVRTKWNK